MGLDAMVARGAAVEVVASRSSFTIGRWVCAM
jgi:hypothetical protein